MQDKNSLDGASILFEAEDTRQRINTDSGFRGKIEKFSGSQ